MKVHAIFPMLDLYELGEADDRVRECISVIANLVTDCLRRDGDEFHYTVDWRDPGTTLEDATSHLDSAEPHIVQLNTVEALRDRVRASVDPFNPTGTIIRSIATCRAVAFGYDGQAFICLRHEDTPPASSAPSLVTIEEQSDILLNFDYFDGLLPHSDADPVP